jgi:hypothetical protein
MLHYAVKHKQGEIVIRAIESGATVCVLFSLLLLLVLFFSLFLLLAVVVDFIVSVAC